MLVLVDHLKIKGQEVVDEAKRVMLSTKMMMRMKVITSLLERGNKL